MPPTRICYAHTGATRKRKRRQPIAIYTPRPHIFFSILKHSAIWFPRVFDHARQTGGDHETRVDAIDINGKMIKEGRALERLCITTVRALFTCPLTGLFVFYVRRVN